MVQINTVRLLKYIDADNKPIDAFIVDFTDTRGSSREQTDIAAQQNLFAQALGGLLVDIEGLCLVGPVDRLGVVNFALGFQDVNDHIGGGIAAANHQGLDTDIFGGVIDIFSHHLGIAIHRQFAGDVAAEREYGFPALEIAFGGDNRQAVAFIPYVFKGHIGLDVQILMLDKVLDILQVTLDSHRFVRRSQLIHHERLGGVLRFGGIDQFAFGIGIG